MSFSFADRKKIELRQKLAYLLQEFRYWLEQSREGAPLEKHHTQIRAVVNHLLGFRQHIEERLKRDETPDVILESSRNLELLILGVRRIWEYFRAKWVQRSDESFRPYLRMADELAWACYAPARRLAFPDSLNRARREPPLVYLNGGSSPFAISREQAFEAELVVGEALESRTVKSLLDSLPIPVVGVPWYQVAHLPDALVIAHEVGHTVEDDFHLTDRLRELLRTSLGNSVNLPNWETWLGESFADLYGCTALGPAFVSSLMDFLAIAPAEVADEAAGVENADEHPPVHLRTLLNIAALDVLGFHIEATDFRSRWMEAYSWPHYSHYEKDLEHIARGLLEGTFSTFQGQRLRDVVSFDATSQKQANTAVLQMFEGGRPNAATDVRTLMAAARLLYDKNPLRFASHHQTILDCLREMVTSGTRAGEEHVTEDWLKQRDRINQQKGREFFTHFERIVVR